MNGPSGTSRTTDPATDLATDLAADRVTALAADRASDPATDLATDLAADRATDLTADRATDLTAEGATEDMITSTRRGVIERMADPYLTDHDRWVLRQFAYFLSGLTPDPDPRATRVRPEGPLPQGVGRSRV